MNLDNVLGRVVPDEILRVQLQKGADLGHQGVNRSLLHITTSSISYLRNHTARWNTLQQLLRCGHVQRLYLTLSCYTYSIRLGNQGRLLITAHADHHHATLLEGINQTHHILVLPRVTDQEHAIALRQMPQIAMRPLDGRHELGRDADGCERRCHALAHSARLALAGDEQLAPVVLVRHDHVGRALELTLIVGLPITHRCRTHIQQQLQIVLITPKRVVDGILHQLWRRLLFLHHNIILHDEQVLHDVHVINTSHLHHTVCYPSHTTSPLCIRKRAKLLTTHCACKRPQMPQPFHILVRLWHSLPITHTHLSHPVVQTGNQPAQERVARASVVSRDDIRNDLDVDALVTAHAQPRALAPGRDCYELGVQTALGNAFGGD